MPPFQIHSPYEPKGDQPQAIAELTEGLARNDRFQTLLGATGTGKTYTMAHVIAKSRSAPPTRYLGGREPGERPACLVDYFPENFVIIVDESHVTVPQIHGMYRGDRSRKQMLAPGGRELGCSAHSSAHALTPSWTLEGYGRYPQRNLTCPESAN